MEEHFENMKELIQSIHKHNKKYTNSTIKYFFDQPIFNYHCNLNNLNDTKVIGNKIKLFPDIKKNYLKKYVMIHFTGIGDCQTKLDDMKFYLKIYI